MERLTVAFLGTPEVRYGERRLTFPTRKTLALFAYLATEGGLHSREKLIALLWPESDEASGRSVLRTTLERLRRALRTANPTGAYLAAEQDLLGLAPAAAIDLDLQALRTASDLAQRQASTSPGQLTATLNHAASRYRGDFLEGFSLEDAPDFDEWASVQREAWHRRADLVFDRLARLLADGGELPRALETTARWVAIAPLNEAAHRHLMRLHFAVGDRAAALRAYASCRAILARELNAEPTPETVALAARLRAAAPELEPDLRPHEPAIPLVTVEGPLVGRSGEHAQLVAAFRAARRGAPQAIGVEGEAGIGKTRLATAFLRWAAAQGADLLVGRAHETGGRLPYGPLVEALRDHLDRESDLRPLLRDVWLVELGRLLPEVYDRYPRLPAPPGLDEAEARQRLFEALAHLGSALAARAPVVWLVDDLQWADAASLDALAYVARRWVATGVPVLLLYTLRSEEANTSPALTTWLAGLARDLPLSRLTLESLTAEETAQLARSLGGPAAEAESISPPLGSRLSDRNLAALGDWLYAETGGHPLFLTETVRALFDRGVLRPDGAGGWAATPEGTPGEYTALRGFLAPGVQEVIRARLAPLGAAARAALAAGAVLGDGFDFARLCQVAGLDEDAGLPALDDLLARRLLREVGRRYRFGHDKIREVAYAEAGAARQRVLHRRALATLEAARVPAAERARHALAAGLTEQAWHLCVAAGDDAMRLFATRDAIAHYERARQLAEPSAADDIADPTVEEDAPPNLSASGLHHFHAQLGRAYELVARYAEARTAYEAMLATARVAAAPTLECAALNRLADLASIAPIDLDRQAALLQAALAVAEASGDVAGLIGTELSLSRLSVFRSEFAAARAHGRRAVDLSRAHELREPLARTLGWLALAEVYCGRWSSALPLAEEARALGTALGDQVLEANVLDPIATARIRLGETQAGIAAARAGHTLGRTIEHRMSQAGVAKELALGLAESGDYAAALEAAEAAVVAARTAGYIPLLILVLAVTGRVQRQAGSLAAARAAHEEAWTIQAAVGAVARHVGITELTASELCADCVASESWAEAADWARQALAARTYETLLLGLSRWEETAALLRAGEIAAATEDVHRFGIQIGDSPRYRIPHLRALATLAEWRGDLDQALAHLQQAATLADALNLPAERWGIASALGSLHRTRGETELAHLSAARAAELIHSLAATIQNEDLRTTFLAAPHIHRLLIPNP